MKDIFAILASKGYEIKDEDKEAIKKEVAENYKTVNEHQKKLDDIKAKEDDIKKKDEAIADMKKQIEALENEDVDGLKQTIKKYEDAETARKNAEEQAKKTAELKASFETLKGDKKYRGGDDGYNARGLFEDWRKAVDDESNKGKSYKEIYEALTKDRDDIFESPNTQVDIPPAGKTGGEENKPKFKNFF